MTMMVCESVLSASFIGHSSEGLVIHFVIVCMCYVNVGRSVDDLKYRNMGEHIHYIAFACIFSFSDVLCLIWNCCF
jgi:hypothetical protein